MRDLKHMETLILFGAVFANQPGFRHGVRHLVYSIPEMKSKKWIAYLHLLGLPEGLPFVLFCSLLGSVVTTAPLFFTIALGFAVNLAIYCFAQIYKHISNAPEDTFSPSPSDPNPISFGLVNLRSTRIGLYLALLTALVGVFLLSRINIVLTFSTVLLTLALFHPNIRLSNHLALGFNQHHFLYGGIFLLNSIFANQTHTTAIEILFPFLFITSLYLLYRVEETQTSLPQHQTMTFWRILYASILVISAAVTFIILKPLPFLIIALWVFLAALQLSISFSKHSESSPHQYIYLFNVFEVSGVVSFLVYLIFVFINTYKS